MKNIFPLPNGIRETAELRFRVGDLDLPERKRYTSRQEEEEDAQVCPCGKVLESRTPMVGEFEMYKKERDVFECEMGKIDEFDMEKFGTLGINSEKMITVLGERWGPQTAKQEGGK